MATYEIRYSIYRNGRRIGFGTSGNRGDVDAASYAIETDIQRRQWETTRSMPDPREVDVAKDE